MTTTRILGASLALLALSASPPPTASRVAASADSFSASTLESVIRQEVAEGFSGSVLVAKGDHVILSRGYGSIRDVPMRADTRFWISSTGKQFVSAGILLLQEQHRLSLSDSIGRWLPEAPLDRASITILQLLSHTSGIPQGYEGEQAKSNSEAVRRILAVPLEAPIGQRFIYSNDNYQLAAAILERANGFTLREFEQRYFFRHLGLKDTGIENGPARVAPAHNATPQRLLDPSWGIEGHYSSAPDLFRWYRALRTGRVLDKSSLMQLWTPAVQIQEGQAALGWFVSKTALGTRRVWTRGNDDFGPNSLLYTYPDRDLVIIILTHAGQKNDNVTYSRDLLPKLESALKV